MKKKPFDSYLSNYATKIKEKKIKISDLGPDKFLHGKKGPWPQPSPAHPFGESPAVLSVPLREWADWWLHVGSRYMFTLFKDTLPDYIWGLTHPGLKELSDEKFLWYLTDTMLCKFLCNRFDQFDNEIFKNYMNDGKEYFISDFEAVKVVSTFPGIYASATKVLLERNEDDWKLICIYVDDTEQIFTADDGDAWSLAKYFVLQGGGLCATLVVHPNLHFPVDSINAISKTALPKDHVLFKLLHPHLRFTLPLECAVLTFKTSLLQSKWWMPYAPYPGEYNGLRDLLVCGFKGVPDNNTYTEYTFRKKPENFESGYSRFQNEYFEVIREFVSKVLKDVEDGDRVVKHWADYIAHWVPGFPNGEEIFEGENLVDVVSYYIWDITVGHSIDHYDYGRMDVQEIPLRIRQAPPRDKDTKINRKTLTNAVDHMKYKMAQKLFFAPTNVTRLMDVNYNFDSNRLRELNAYFREDLRKTAKKLKETSLREYIPLEEIACSIQY